MSAVVIAMLLLYKDITKNNTGCVIQLLNTKKVKRTIQTTSVVNLYLIYSFKGLTAEEEKQVLKAPHLCVAHNIMHTIGVPPCHRSLKGGVEFDL